MSNTIKSDVSYKVSGEQLMRVSDLIGALRRDINFWRSGISDAFGCVSDDPMSAAKFVAKIARVALNIESDMKAYDALWRIAFDMAGEAWREGGEE